MEVVPGGQELCQVRRAKPIVYRHGDRGLLLGRPDSNTVDHPTDTYGMLAYGYREPMKQKAAATGSLRGQYAYYAKRLGEIVAAHPWPAALACSRSLEGNVPEPLSSGSWSPLNRVFYVLVAWGAYKLFREYDEGARDLAGAVRPVLLGTDRDQLLARRKTGFPARAVPIRTIRLCLRAAASRVGIFPQKAWTCKVITRAQNRAGSHPDS